MTKLTPLQRFERLYQPEPNSGCWLWLGCLFNGGYGSFRANGKSLLAHRWAYEHFVGPIADGLELDHLCRVRCCVNPRHLEPVSKRENQRRGIGWVAKQMAATHCPKGHEYTPENTRVWHGNSRSCWTCWKACQRARRARKRWEAQQLQS